MRLRTQVISTNKKDVWRAWVNKPCAHLTQLAYVQEHLEIYSVKGVAPSFHTKRAGTKHAPHVYLLPTRHALAGAGLSTHLQILNTAKQQQAVSTGLIVTFRTIILLT
jgi:hypothetical protein